AASGYATPEELASGDVGGDLMLALTALVSLGALGVTALFLRWGDRIAWSALFATRRWGRDTLVGLLVTILQLGLVFLAMAAAGWLRWESASPPPPAGGWALYLPLLVLGFLIQGGSEEVITRGYLLRTLQQGAGLPAALIVTALLFAVAHGLNPGAGGLAFLNIALIGLLYGLVVVRFSLWAAVIAHASWNLLLGILGAPVSGVRIGALFEAQLQGPEIWTGGAFGPEASLITAITSALGCLLLLLWPGWRACLRKRRTALGMARAPEAEETRNSGDLRETLSYNYARTPSPPGDGADDPPHPAGRSAPPARGPDPRDST
ncbi:MAG: CPBP family intramembrane metalloprotease, partial [Candidatus Eisenbacteria bacterium]|nr:CPBP family intramembrane metalloprotease [Candidatus Eisenbacteria bacterium]